MNKNIFANGLPEELENLKFGQVVIFSSPGEGMSENNIRISQYISSVAKQLKKSSVHVEVPAVYVVPTENTDLWDYIACKVAINKTSIIELSDKGSLTEMLFDYWGLDFDIHPKPVIIDRYKAYNFTIADYHPFRIGIEPVINDPSAPQASESNYFHDFSSVSLNCICAKGKEPKERDIFNKILKIYMEADMYGIKIDNDKIQKKVEEQRNKSYTLDIEIELNQHNKISKCDIILFDENGDKNFVKLEAQEKAIYLAFILYNEGNGVKMTDFDYPNRPATKAFLSLLDKIHNKMINRNETKGNLDKKGVCEIRSRIKNKISKITINPRCVQSFSIEGEMEGLYKIEASTEEIRNKIMEVLNL